MICVSASPDALSSGTALACPDLGVRHRTRRVVDTVRWVTLGSEPLRKAHSHRVDDPSHCEHRTFHGGNRFGRRAPLVVGIPAHRTSGTALVAPDLLRAPYGVQPVASPGAGDRNRRRVVGRHAGRAGRPLHPPVARRHLAHSAGERGLPRPEHLGHHVGDGDRLRHRRRLRRVRRGGDDLLGEPGEDRLSVDPLRAGDPEDRHRTAVRRLARLRAVTEDPGRRADGVLPDRHLRSSRSALRGPRDSGAHLHHGCQPVQDLPEDPLPPPRCRN